MGACTNDVSLGVSVSVAPDSVEDTGVENAGPCLAATPFRVEFGFVRRGELREHELRITNGCDAPVGLTGFTLSGASDFGVAVGEHRWKSSPQTATAGVDLDEPWMVPARGEVVATVSYEPSQPDVANGVLVWLAEDHGEALSLVVKLEGNDQTSCIATQPKTLDYGGKVAGEAVTREVAMTSCGDGALLIEAINLLSLQETDSIESPFVLTELNQPLPWVLEPGETRSVNITYTPTGVAGVNEEGERIRDRANLLLVTDAFEGDHEVGMSGFGVLDACPEAVIDFQGESVVPPASSVVFEGGDSWSPDGSIETYQWTRELPDGAIEALAEGPSATSVSVDLSMVGEHTIRLSVQDSTGLMSCAPGEATLTVEAASGLHVELIWLTGGDPNPLDQGFEKGSDLDLHLLHPLAVGEDVDGDGSGDGWFDHPLDTFWGNQHPNWGQVGDPKITDDPELLRDDVDSYGPEVLVLGEPQQGATYRIGVHSWAEHGFGPSEARVRVWLDGALEYTSENVLLHEGELWEVGAVSPSDGLVTPLFDEADAPVVWQLAPDLLSKP